VAFGARYAPAMRTPKTPAEAPMKTRPLGPITVSLCLMLGACQQDPYNIRLYHDGSTADGSWPDAMTLPDGPRISDTVPEAQAPDGLSYDASDDSILISLRNQSAVLKVDRSSKRIKWILGNHRGWPEHLRDRLLTPVGDLKWPGYQHNPRMTHAGTVILFDNRAHGGAMAFEEPLAPHLNFSRGVEYAVNETAMTVEQIWSSGDTQTPDSCYTHAMSDAWRMPVTDNRLVIHAFCVPRVEGLTEDIMDHTRRVAVDFPMGGRILEFDGEEVVCRAKVKDSQEVIQWEVYGGFKSPGLYEMRTTTH